MRLSILAIAVAIACVACSDDDSEGSAGSGGTSGTGATSNGGSAGLGGSAGSGASGGSGGTPIEPPLVCTDQCVYVRPGATGASGADWNDALAALPPTLERGKVYLIADGDYGDRTFDDTPSGEKPITIHKATASSHGTDVGWQSGFGDGVALFSGVSFASSYYVFDGVSGGGVGAWNSGHGIEIQRTGNACKDNGALIHFGAGASHIVVRHVRAHANNYDYPMNGVKGTGGASDLTFSHNWIHTTFGPTFHIGDWKDVLIENNFLADVRSTGAGDPFCPDWHAEGVSSIGTNENIVIRYNLWDEIGGTAVFAGVNQGASIGWKIYGNVFARSQTTIAYYDEAGGTNHQTMQELEFYDNAIVKMPGSSVGTILIQAGSNNRASNNIWYDNIANTFSFQGITHDHGFFSENRRVEGCSPVCDKDDEAATDDANSQVSSGSPFVNGDVDPVSADFHLQVATDPGATLPAPFDVDPEGRTRGADGNWDRGVYELMP